MLYAEAKSVREERSKQRYALQEFSYLRVSLVRGRHTWRIGSAETIRNDYAAAVSREGRGSVTLVYKFLRRYIQGEEPAPKLFDFCVATLPVLATEISERSFVELYIQVALLTELGYVAHSALPDWFSITSVDTVAGRVSDDATEQLRLLIEEAVTQSQL
jgi:recombinational DNA repair protein (RecF pathway)